MLCPAGKIRVLQKSGHLLQKRPTELERCPTPHRVSACASSSSSRAVARPPADVAWPAGGLSPACAPGPGKGGHSQHSGDGTQLPGPGLRATPHPPDHWLQKPRAGQWPTHGDTDQPSGVCPCPCLVCSVLTLIPTCTHGQWPPADSSPKSGAGSFFSQWLRGLRPRTH